MSALTHPLWHNGDMKKSLFLFSMLCALCSPTGTHSQFRKPEHASRRIQSITMERTPCFGSCPVYKVTLKPDGTLTYVGTRFVSKIGTYSAKFWGAELQDLLAPLLDKLNVWTMKSRYSAGATDMPSQIVTIVTDKGTKVIDEYGPSGPKELWAVQRIIDSLVAEATDWKKLKSK